MGAKTEGAGTADIFSLAKTLRQMSQKSTGSSGSKRVKLTSKEKFKGLALKAIKQEHGEDDPCSPLRRSDPIGSTATSIRRKNASFKTSLMARGNSADMADNICLLELDTEQLVSYNPKLASFTPATRIAYARFKNMVKKEPLIMEDDEIKSTLTVENEKKSNGQLIGPTTGSYNIYL